METGRLYNVFQMAKDFDTYRDQVKAMIDHYGIPTQWVGRMLVVDQAGYEAVRDAVATHKARPRIKKSKARSKPATA